MNTNKILNLVILTVIALVPVLVFAQPAPPPPPPPPVGVPIDGGIALLLGSLAAYGMRKLYKK